MTAVSDLEVEYSEEPGTLYYFKYMLADGSGEYIPVATTRPETILGDTAVAVHPEDPRYQKFVGKQVVVPIIGRAIPVIADDYVEREFGTGALKITPGHDPHDYEIGQRHNLALINILNKDATLNENAGPYTGLDRFEARKKLWEDMRAQGLVIKEEPYMLNVPRSMRGGEIIEPLVSTQWFVKMDSLAQKAKAAVEAGEIIFVPERFTKIFTIGWITFRIGASAGSCGGGIAFQSGIARIAEKRLWRARRQRNAPSVAVLDWNRIQMYWILGSLRGCGPSRCLAGQMKPLITSTFIPPRSWRRGMTSSSSGWLV